MVSESARRLGRQTLGLQARDVTAAASDPKRLPNAADGTQSSAEREPGGPLAGLLSLLRRFKAARRRRDDAQYGSPSWLDADGEIASLQRQIFDLPLEDRPSNVYRYDPDEDVDDEESELGRSGNRAAD